MEEEIKYEAQSDCEDYEDYCPGGYHPAYLGERINGRYTIIQKLGWGHFSTVWLVEKTDEPRQQFALKIQRSVENHAETAIDEIELLKELRKHEQDKGWVDLVESGFQIQKLQQMYSPGELHRIFRPLLLVDTFQIFGVHGKHYCSVFELMGPNLLDVIQHHEYKDVQMPLQLVKKITRDVLIGLVYLHEFVGMIHTDIKPENILIKLTPEEQALFVEGLRNYKVRPLSMKFLHNKQSKNPSKNKKKYDKKKLKKKQAKEQQGNPSKEGNETEEPASSVAESVPNPAPNPAVQGIEPESPVPVNQTIKEESSEVTKNAVELAPAGLPEKKKKKKSKKKKEAGQQNPPKEEVTKPRDRQPGKKKKGPQKKVPTGKLTTVKPAQSQQNNSDSNQDDYEDVSDDSSEGKIKQEYTQEELDNLKWKGININLKKDIHFKICDFGNACMHANHFTEQIQTREYRSPEVIIGHDYLPNTDVWSVGCMVYELLTNTFLFKPRDSKGISKDEDHLYMMAELLGPFPKNLALEGTHSKQFFNKKGDLIHGMPKSSLSMAELLIEDFHYPQEEAIAIEDFLRPMLEYEPSKRISALQCLKSQWLWT